MALTQVSDTRYGRTKAKKAAQAVANKAGRRVFLQMSPEGFPSTKLDVMISGEDGRGPFYIGAPFWTFYPEQANNKETGR